MGDLLMNTYRNEVTKAMNMLAEDDDVIFLGQSINYWDCMYGTMKDILLDKKLEVPIMEDTQMGISTGLALKGYIPVSVYSRMDFLILAMNQLVNHLDKIEIMSYGEFKPRVIIRTIVGSKTPLHPGEQHCQDHSEVFKAALQYIDVVELKEKRYIVPAYRRALQSRRSTLIVEHRELYDK